MSLNPLAPAFLPHYQSSSDPLVSLCNCTTMGLPLAQLICGMPPQTIPSHAPSINQHITHSTFHLPLLQPTNWPKSGAAVHQPTPGSSAFLPSPLQHQANCLQAIHKTIQQFNQHSKAEHLDRHYNSLFFNCKMSLPYCATCSSPRLRQYPTRILPLKIPLLVLYRILTLTLTLTLTLLPLFSHFPVLVNRNFIVLPRWALWDHPERKTILQKLIPSPHPTCRKLLQLQCRTSHQEFSNWKNCLPINYQLTQPSLRGSIPSISSHMINFASLNLDIQMSLIGKIPQ